MRLFDHSAPPLDFTINPYPLLAAQQGDGGIWFHPEREAWVVADFDLISQLLRSPDLELAGSNSFADRSDNFRGHFVHPLRPWFKPPFSAEVTALVQKVASTTVATLLRQTETDLVPALARQVPLAVMAGLLGLPPADIPKLADLGRHVLRGYDLSWPGQPTSAAKVARNLLRAYFRHRLAVEPLAAATPLMRLMREAWEGHDLPEASLHDACAKMITAGATTTAGALANILARLLSLLDGGAELPPADRLSPWVEEFLRLDPPILALQRRAMRDITVEGRHIGQGQSVLLLTAAANRDPARFPEPDRFRPDRADNQHISFGQGAFYCLGAHLARLEISAVLAALAPQSHRIRLAAPASFAPAWLIHEVTSLPVTIDQ